MDRRAIKDTHDTSGRKHALLAACSCFGAILVLVGTQHGAAVTPDSATYIAAARSLLADGGFVSYDGRPFAAWPPLYPSLLGLGGCVGMDPMQTARVLHALAFGSIIYIAGRLFFGHLRDTRVAMIGVLAVVLSWPLLHVAVKIWSETVFILLVLVFLAYASRVLNHTTSLRVALFAAVAALGVMTRYAGLALVIAGTGSILIGAREASVRERLAYATAFSTMALAPLVLWFVRNYSVSSTLTGSRSTSTDPAVTASASHMIETLTTWLAPPLLPAWVGGVVGVLLVAAIVIGRFAAGQSTRQHGVIVLFAAVYAAIVLASSAMGAAALPDNRLLTPLYVPLLFLVLAALDDLLLLTSSTRLRNAVLGACTIWLLFSAGTVLSYVAIRAAYDTNAWHESDMVQWLEKAPPEGRLYSNRAWVVYLATDRHTRQLPAKGINTYLARESELHGHPYAVVWFSGEDRGTPHVARLMDDLFGRFLPAVDHRVTDALLGFMQRGGIALRDDPIVERPPDIPAEAPRLFKDGSLYVITSLQPADE